MPFTYILECNDGSYYTGSTWNLKKRITEHGEGLGANYTAKRLPVRLIYFEEYDRIEEAYKREKQIQGWTHEKKKALFENNIDYLHKLSECKNESHYENFLE